MQKSVNNFYPFFNLDNIL
ncbi:MAG: hypothetical protein K0S93_2054, partial [Nitrososphaeraceae archaeon]|nr:hypothetical protein [Nitrososphaeraceae archaeon]